MNDNSANKRMKNERNTKQKVNLKRRKPNRITKCALK